MSSISIIGLGGMARAIGARAVEGGNAVEVIGRDAAKAKDLAAALGGGATAGTFGTAPAGDIVILAERRLRARRQIWAVSGTRLLARQDDGSALAKERDRPWAVRQGFRQDG